MAKKECNTFTIKPEKSFDLEFRLDYDEEGRWVALVARNNNEDYEQVLFEIDSDGSVFADRGAIIEMGLTPD